MALKEQIELYFKQDAGSLDRVAALRAFNELKFFLNSGDVRAASRSSKSKTGWNVNDWVKKGIILGFRLGELVDYSEKEQFRFFDKYTYPLKRLTLDHNVRLVPGGSSVRDGANVAKGVVIMPPAYINTGAYVDEGTMIDSHADSPHGVYLPAKQDERIHCALIVQTMVGLPKTLKNMATFFTFDDYIVQQIWKVFTNINRTFTSSGPVTPVMLPHVKGFLYSKQNVFFLPVVSQYIDIYGKARMLTVRYNNELISFMCDPVAPYASPISTDFVRTSTKLVLQLVNLFKATVIEQRSFKDVCREVVITVPSLSVQDPRYLKHQNINRPVDGIKLVVLCNDTSFLKNTPINTNVEYETVFKYEKTPLTLYDTNRKTTKLLVHHALYMFSKSCAGSPGHQLRSGP